MKVREIVESTGAQVMAFTDYLERGLVSEKYQSDFARLGADLFKLGFTYKSSGPTEHAAPHFTRKIISGPGAGGAQSVSLPTAAQGGYKSERQVAGRSDGVHITYLKVSGMKFLQVFYPIWDVHSIGLQFLLDKTIELAKP
jgi:hypothetical protein